MKKKRVNYDKTKIEVKWQIVFTCRIYVMLIYEYLTI